MTKNVNNYRPTPDKQRVMAFSNIGSHTMIAAQVSKLREGNMPHHQKNAPQVMTGAAAQADMARMSQEQQIRSIDNENALQLMPEIEWACRVLISSIRSPKDMVKSDLNYSIDLPWLNPNVKSAILDEVKRDMQMVYDYSDSLHHIFKDCLFKHGSHPRLVLPEAAVDQIINSGHELTMERLSDYFDPTKGEMKPTGYFGPRTREGSTERMGLTMESFRRAAAHGTPAIADEQVYLTVMDENGKSTEVTLEGLLTVTDNFNAVKMPFYLDSVAASKREANAQRPVIDFGDFDFAKATPTMENFQVTQINKASKLSENEMRSLIYKGAPTNMVTHMRIPGQETLRRRSVGRPLVMSIPAEAVIPLHVPGDVRRKVGAVIFFEDGHPISLQGSDQVIARAQALYNSTQNSNTIGASNTGSMIISKAARNLAGGGTVTPFADLPRIVEQMMDQNIVPRLMNGAYPGGVAMSHNTDLYMLMVSRILCSLRTRMVFVPAEMMTYFAFDYHSNGMGKSLLDNNKTLIAMRAGLLLTRATSEMKNAIPLTKITMHIDERDNDWEKTLEETSHIITQTRQPQFPLGSLNVNDMMDWIHQAGIFFAFDGHPRLPDTGFDFEKIQHDIPLPDQEFYDNLGKQLYMGFGIPPELMDSTYDPEFAIAVASRNIMFTQTILEFQKIASGLVTDDHHRLILSDGIMMNKIVEIVREKWGEIVSRLPQEDKASLAQNPKTFAIDLVKRIIQSIVVSFPSPDATTLENQAETYRNYSQFLDDTFDNFAGDDVISADIAPELQQKISSMAPMIKAAMKRDFMAENNMLPELFRMSATDEDGKPQFDLLKTTEAHTMGLAANLMSAALAMAPIEEAVKKDSDTMNLGDEGGSAGGFGGGGEGDFGGGDPFGGGGGEDPFSDMSAEFNETSTGDQQKPDEQQPQEGGEQTPAI